MKDKEPFQTVLAESSHYMGTAGYKYFDWQNKHGEVNGRIEARKFKPYVKPADAVLDFGCGGGHILRSLDCAKRVGVEINPAARTIATQGGIECYETTFDVQDNSFDVVISNHALEHVQNPVSVLRALRDKLRASGVLVLCVPIDDWRTQRTYDREDINHHLHTWTPQLFGNSLLEAGFDPNLFSVRILTHAWFPGTARIYGKLPELPFDVFCQLFAFISNRRQLLAVARKHAEL